MKIYKKKKNLGSTSNQNRTAAQHFFFYHFHRFMIHRLFSFIFIFIFVCKTQFTRFKIILYSIILIRIIICIIQIDHPQQQSRNVYRSVVSIQRKRAVIACFRQTSLHSLPRCFSNCSYSFFSLLFFLISFRFVSSCVSISEVK